VLSGNGARLFFERSFQDGASWRHGLGYLDVASGEPVRLTSSSHSMRTVSNNGRRTAYQMGGSTAGAGIQYFVVDEATGEE
jgi:hypothetical protein